MVEPFKENLNFMEKMAISKVERPSVPLEPGKENRVRKNSEGSSNMVKCLKMRYEEISMSRNNVMSTGEENSRATGAIKKRVEFGKGKILGSKKRVEFQDDSTIGPKKRIEFADDKSGGTKKRVKSNIDENDVFAKSRFMVYADEKLHSSQESVSTKLDEKFVENFHTTRMTCNQRTSRMIQEPSLTVQERFTPIDALGVSLIPKKVKVQYRNSLMTKSEKPNNFTGSIAQSCQFQQPYEDNFVKLELQKEKTLSGTSKGFRKLNITSQQRNIIIKFLIRLNAHSFYPSFFLYQTVRIFDAVLDAKVIDVEEMQLVALTAMWIVLKREQIVYRVPSAAQILSYSKDLYEGRLDLLLKCEREILQSLNFEIVYPDPFSILCYYIRTCKRAEFLLEYQSNLAYYCGSYMLDLSLFDENLMEKSAALLAAVAAETALFFVMNGEKYETKPWWFKWRSPDAVTRYTDVEIDDVRSILIQRINESHQRHTDGDIIFKKYSRSRYGRISHFLCNKAKLFLTGE